MPTLLGLVLVFLIVGVIALLVKLVGRQSDISNPSLTPQRIIITNVTDTSFTVTWTTGQATTGAAKISEPKNKKGVFFDDRDKNGRLALYTQHSVTVTNRDPKTQYDVELMINGQLYINRENPLKVTTAPDIGPAENSIPPISGTILFAENQPSKDALVYVSLEKGQLLSALVSSSGRWIVPLVSTRTTDLSQYIKNNERTTLMVRAVHGSDETTAITDTLNGSPVPTMIMGRTYDFRKIQAQKDSSLASAQVHKTSDVLGVQSNQVLLATPVDGAALATKYPLISGTGVPGNTVAVVLGIVDPIAGQTTVDTHGTWRFTPPKPLGEGNQSVTITTTNTDNQPVAITHAFTIFKSGTQVLGSATPSATLAPTPTATAPAVLIQQQPIPESGTMLPTYILLFVAAGLIVTGLAFSVEVAQRTHYSK